MLYWSNKNRRLFIRKSKSSNRVERAKDTSNGHGRL